LAHRSCCAPLIDGSYFDSSTGLYKFGTRYYHPGFGRWSQQDPLRGQLNDPTSLNRYLYVGDDPVNFTDPSGNGKDVLGCVEAILTAWVTYFFAAAAFIGVRAWLQSAEASLAILIAGGESAAAIDAALITVGFASTAFWWALAAVFAAFIFGLVIMVIHCWLQR
jgi:RHS repeat-associated protein